MNEQYEVLLRLLTFRNIDLPLQGIYFLRVSFSSQISESSIVPYYANEGTIEHHRHCLSPCAIRNDDSLRSSVFIIQFTHEEVHFGDSFRLTYTRPDGATSGEFETSDDSLSDTLVVFELFFTNGADLGGINTLSRSLQCPPFSSFNATARAAMQIPSLSTSQYFRVPLGLLKEPDSVSEVELDSNGAEMLACAYIEGIFASALIRVDLQISVHGDGARSQYERALSKLDHVLHRMDSKQWGTTQNIVQGSTSSSTACVSRLIEAVREREAYMRVCWEDFLRKVDATESLKKFKDAWKQSLVRTASKFAVRTGETDRGPFPDDRMESVQLLSRLDTSNVPILHTESDVDEDRLDAPDGAHLIVVAHGYQGTGSDVRVIRNTVAIMCPQAVILTSIANEDQTEGDIGAMGIRLAMEIHEYMRDSAKQQACIEHISFISHSMGGLIVRSALPHLSDIRDKFNAFISLSTPHLGITNSLISSGIQILRIFRRSEALEQMTLVDAGAPSGSFLCRLSTERGLEFFQRVIVVGSEQDQYAPLASSILRPKDSSGLDYMMASNITQRLGCHKLVRIAADFRLPLLPSIDSVIGRAAHIQFLESSVVLQLIIISHSDVFNIC
jgi:hypothetical protein